MMTCNKCPVVLVSAGVGVTPMMSMLHVLAAEDTQRPVWFVHGVRDGAHHPLAREARELAKNRKGISIHAAYSRPRPKDRIGIDYDSVGRVNGDLLANLIANIDAHYFLCGPIGFMADLQSDLERRSIPGEHIHTESFGPIG